MNKKLGIIASAVTLLGVIGFALSMLFGAEYLSYLSSMFIAWGFVPMICAFAATGRADTKAAGYTAVAFAAVYAVFIMLVYFTQLTAVRLSVLPPQAEQILDYTKFGLFFSLDLLGYGFMALATFFAALTVMAETQGDKWLRGLLAGHGLFAVACVIMPMLGLFSADTAGADLIGVLILEFWCVYFIPVSILAWRHFAGKQKAAA